MKKLLISFLIKAIQKMDHIGAFKYLDLRYSPLLKPSYPEGIYIGDNVSIAQSATIVLGINGSVKFCGGNYVGVDVEMGGNGKIVLGEGTAVQNRGIILGDVTIGNYCLLAPNVYISSGRHNFRKIPELYIQEQDRLKVKNLEPDSELIEIEDDVWVGINSVIMPGIRISKGAVIGANSVVNSDVSPYSIVAGAPAKVIGKRLDFQPKSKINSGDFSDLPYFYKGLKVLIADHGGFVCEEEFVLAMKGKGSHVEIQLLNLLLTETKIKAQEFEATLTVSDVIQLLNFPLSSNEFQMFHLSNCNDLQGGRVIILKAEIV